MPILYMFMNYLNSFPDDDQVYEVRFFFVVLFDCSCFGPLPNMF